MKFFTLVVAIVLTSQVFAGGKIPSIGPKKRWAGTHAASPILSLDKLGKNRLGWFEPIGKQELRLPKDGDYLGYMGGDEKKVQWIDDSGEDVLFPVAIFVDPTGKKIVGRSEPIKDCEKFVADLNAVTPPIKYSTSSQTVELQNSDILINGKSLIGDLMPTRGDSAPGEEAQIEETPSPTPVSQEGEGEETRNLLVRACHDTHSVRRIGMFSSIHVFSVFGPYLQFQAETIFGHGCQNDIDESEYSSKFLYIRRDESGNYYRANLKELIDEEKSHQELSKIAKKMNKKVDELMGPIGPCGGPLVDDRFAEAGVQFVLDDYDIKKDRIVGRLWDSKKNSLVRDAKAYSVNLVPVSDTIRGYLKDAKNGKGLIAGKKPVAAGSPTTLKTYDKFFENETYNIKMQSVPLH